MAWDFRFQVGSAMKICGFILIHQCCFFLLLLSTNFGRVNGSFQFDCGPVRAAKDGCNCDTSPEGSSWEVECPRGLVEVPDIIIKVKKLNGTTASLTVGCNAYHPENEMPWRMLKGLDFLDQESKFNVTALTFDRCPLSATNNTLQDFLVQVKLNPSLITSFTFSPPRNAPSASSALSSASQTFQPLSTFISSLENLETLELKGNKLITIPNLSNLPKLKVLGLRENEISHLSPDVFKTSSNLILVDLGSNQIDEIPDHTFPPALRRLYLQNNKIFRLTNQTFSNLKNLELLVLRNNPLRALDRGAFLSLAGLKTLDLLSTYFENFPLLRNLTNLESINLSYRDHSVRPTREENSTFGRIESFPNDFNGSIENLPNLLELILTSIGLEEIPVLDLPKLAKLKLDKNRIKEIRQDSFRRLTSLTNLDLSQNNIQFLEEIHGPNLLELDLSQNHLKGLSFSALMTMGRLTKLKLNKNLIDNIHTKAFASLSNLKYLDLSENQLSTMAHLTVLPDAPDGKDPALFAHEFGQQSVLRFCMQLEELYMKNNSVNEIYEDWKVLMSKLRVLDLSHNKLNKLDVFDINFFSRDLKLDIRSNEITSVIMDNAEYLLDGAENRRLVIRIDDNPINCNCNQLSFKRFNLKGITFEYKNLTCHEPPELKGFQFSKVPDSELLCVLNGSFGCPEICSCWKVPGNKTIIVDCSYRNLTDFIPNVHINCSIEPTFGVQLNLAGNQISSINVNHTRNFSDRTTQIDLSENKLSDVSFLSLVASNNDTILYLANNRFACGDCNFHRTLRKHFKQISDLKNVSCVSEEENDDGSAVRLFVDEIPDSQVCPMDSMTAEIRALIIAVGIITAAFVALVAVYIRHGWALRAFLYSKGLGYCLTKDDSAEDSEKIYDAFVSFSHKDEEWVLTQLVNRLEEQEGFKLCLHFRDWTPGDWIPDQIVRSVDKSRRTVVILSKNFVESIWSRLEFKAAHSQALNEKGNRLILILVEEDLVASDVQDDDLKVYMKMNTYLKWGDPWFWHKLKYALPHKKSISVQNHYAKQQQHERAIKLDKLRSKMENTVP